LLDLERPFITIPSAKREQIMAKVKKTGSAKAKKKTLGAKAKKTRVKAIAKQSRPMRLRVCTPTIIKPTPGGSYPVCPGVDTISVEVQDQCSGSLMVQIFEYDATTGVGGADGEVDFTSDSSAQSSAAKTGTTLGYKWLSAILPPSFSTGFLFSVYSGICSNEFLDAAPATLLFCPATPVHAGTSTRSDQVNRPARLFYNKGAEGAITWVSRALIVGAANDQAYWVLEKRPRKWSLLLKRKTGTVVTYEKRIPAAGDRHFPLQGFTLSRSKPLGKEFKQWPGEITIYPDA
jgi:hypothetical protein